MRKSLKERLKPTRRPNANNRSTSQPGRHHNHANRNLLMPLHLKIQRAVSVGLLSSFVELFRFSLGYHREWSGGPLSTESDGWKCHVNYTHTLSLFLYKSFFFFIAEKGNFFQKSKWIQLVIFLRIAALISIVTVDIIRNGKILN